MKPLKLTMQAFGPYKTRQQIDFSAFDDGLLLIAGETGAGKTTIFDALSCALFGDTSGGKRSRSFSQMRPEDAALPTQVELEFEYSGSVYTITRTPSQERPKKRGSGTRIEPGKCRLCLPDGRVYDKKEDVDREIKTLLGIQKEEFRQIVMIAQNDFMAMIKESEGEQEKTFNRIFGAGLYERFDKASAKACADAEAACTALELQLRSALEGVGTEADIADVLASGTPDPAQAADCTARLCSAREKACAHAEDAKKEAAGERAAAEQACAQARESIKKLEACAQAEADLQALEAARASWEEQAAQADRHEVLMEMAEPLRARLAQAQQTEDTRARELETARAEEAAAQRALSAAQDALSTARAGEKALEADRAARARLEETAPLYEKYEHEKKALESVRTQCAELEARQRDLQEKREAARAVALPERASAALRADLEKTRAETLKNEHALSDIDALAAAAKDYQDARAAWLKKKQTADKLIQDYRRQSREYEALQARYWQDQAGVLAQDLKDGAPCPVCGSLSHPHPAHPGAQAPDKADIENAAGRLKALQIRADEAAGAAHTERGKAEQQRAALEGLRETAEALSAATGYSLGAFAAWTDALKDGTDLQAPLAGFRSEYKYLNAHLKAQRSALAEKETQLNDQISQAERAEEDWQRAQETLRALEGALTETAQAFTERAAERAARTATVKDLGARLDCPSAQAAQDEITRLTQRIHEAERALSEAETRAAQAGSAAARAAGRAENLTAQQDNARADTAAAAHALTKALAGHGIKDIETYESLNLSKEVLKQAREAIQAYTQRLAVARSSAETRRAETAGAEHLDLPVLEHALSAAKQREKAAEQAVSDAQIRLHDARRARERVHALTPQITKARALWQNWYAISATVNRRSGTFAQFVLSFYFRRVLERANRRLDHMTYGRYRLEPRRAGALAIDVYDTHTAAARDVKTLSGGETFLASLALALGFSETVQEQSGGVRLDTIFIDEGFGALDPVHLERALDVLDELAGGRSVVIISHVRELAECIPQQLRVKKGADGSRVVVHRLV